MPTRADQHHVVKAANRWVGRHEAAFKAAVKAGRAGTPVEEIEAALDGRDIGLAQFYANYGLAAFEQALRKNLKEPIGGAFIAGAQAELKVARGVGHFVVLEEVPRNANVAYRDALRAARARKYELYGFRAARGPVDTLQFNLTNPEAVAWIETRTLESSTTLTGTTREAIREILAASFTQGFTTAEAARRIREFIGLSAPHARAVENLRQRIIENPGKLIKAGRTRIRVPAGGASADFIARRTQQYADRLLNLRARTIARTETLTAANRGQLELWNEARRQGLLTANEWKVWIVTPDERLCPLCEVLDSERVPLDENFSNGNLVPPDHALCRCTTGLVRAPRGFRAEEAA